MSNRSIECHRHVELEATLRLALVALDDRTSLMKWQIARDAIKEALAQPEQEPVTVLPDGSAFAVMSYPLPKDHWLYAERQYECGADEPNELGKPILTHAVCDAVVSAVRYAIRGATNCGKKLDFDPDALVQNAVYALCGPYGSPKPKEPEKEPMFTYEQVKAHIQAAMMSTTPPQRTWVGLTDDEMFKTWLTVPAETEDRLAFGRAVEAKLKAKNERKEKNTRNGGCL